MLVFTQNKSTLSEIKEKPFKLERDLQQITESNMEKIFWLEFVCTEFSVWEFRIDSLAYDRENQSFVIIEYKRWSSFSVVDQGYSYLALLLNNQAEFVLKYNEATKETFQKKDINRESSRVVFVANGFTAHQKNAINFKDLPIELREAKQFENNILIFDEIKAKKTNASVKTISKDENVSKVNKQVKKYSVDDHFKNDWLESKELYEELSEKILELDSRIEETPTKQYIWYKIGNSNCVEITTYKSKIDLLLNRIKPEDISDPENKVRYIKNSFKYRNKHQSKIEIHSVEDIDYTLMITKQVLKKFFS